MTLRRHASAGFTLIEVLVALALFALISGAGFAMLDQVLRTQNRTEGRLERLAAIQRAMYVLETDFLQAHGRSFLAKTGGDGPTISFRRTAADLADGVALLDYRLQDGILVRIVSRRSGGPAVRQPLLPDVVQADWSFYDPQAGWSADWPPPGQLPGALPPNPWAVELTLTLSDGRMLRRVALLPRDGV